MMLTVPPDEYQITTPAGAFPPVLHLPRLPALTTVKVRSGPNPISPRLADFLSCIHSAPVLSSITFKPEDPFPLKADPNPWIEVDNWLTQLVAQVKDERKLTVVLGDPEWEEYLPEFRKAGGEVKMASDEI